VSVIAIDTFPTITTTTVPGGTINAAYSEAIAVTGTPTPTLAVTAGSLPPGLTLTGDTISGIPTAAGSYSFTLTASSSVSGIPATVSQAYTLVVAALAPDAPLTLTATPDNGTAALTWTAPASDGGAAITGYRIERSVDGAASATLVADTASTALTYTDATVAAGHSYSYRVSALNSAGASAPSNTATVAFAAAGTPGGATPPAGTAGGTSSSVTDPALADTGSNVASPLLLALGLLTAGAAAWTIRRRTRKA
jgi:LPXTG-motif cell wall-anchored protein